MHLPISQDIKEGKTLWDRSSRGVGGILEQERGAPRELRRSEAALWVETTQGSGESAHQTHEYKGLVEDQEQRVGTGLGTLLRRK